MTTIGMGRLLKMELLLRMERLTGGGRGLPSACDGVVDRFSRTIHRDSLRQDGAMKPEFSTCLRSIVAALVFLGVGAFAVPESARAGSVAAEWEDVRAAISGVLGLRHLLNRQAEDPSMALFSDDDALNRASAACIGLGNRGSPLIAVFNSGDSAEGRQAVAFNGGETINFQNYTPVAPTFTGDDSARQITLTVSAGGSSETQTFGDFLAGSADGLGFSNDFGSFRVPGTGSVAVNFTVSIDAAPTRGVLLLRWNRINGTLGCEPPGGSAGGGGGTVTPGVPATVGEAVAYTASRRAIQAAVRSRELIMRSNELVGDMLTFSQSVSLGGGGRGGPRSSYGAGYPAQQQPGGYPAAAAIWLSCPAAARRLSRPAAAIWLSCPAAARRLSCPAAAIWLSCPAAARRLSRPAAAIWLSCRQQQPGYPQQQQPAGRGVFS